MESKINPIGKYITPINEKNKNNLYSTVLGVAIEKEFMPSVANLNGTDLSKYSILRKGRFAFNPMHIGRDLKLPVAMYKKDEPALVSPAYSIFEVTCNELLSEYLELILKSNNFDHLCWFHTDASVRGGLSWDDFADLKINVPSIKEQEKIINDFNVIADRISLLKKINIALEKLINIHFKKEFKPLSFDMKGELTLSRIISFGNGFAFDSESYTKEGKYRIITIGNVNNGFLDTSKVNFLNNVSKKIIENYLLNEGDILISLTGNVGRTALVDEENLLLNQRVSRIICDENSVAFAYALFRCEETRSFLEDISKGTAQLNLSPVELLNVKVDYDLNLIKEFGIKFNKLLKIIINNSKQIKILEKFKDNLLVKLTLGE